MSGNGSAFVIIPNTESVKRFASGNGDNMAFWGFYLNAFRGKRNDV
jgi:hypothetical protein